MDVREFVKELGTEFYAGVPDSQLKVLCDYLIRTYGISDRHMIAANEGNAAALAVGYHLATGKIPLVYMQNSGIGNIVNPVASLLNQKVYRIPCIFVVGWRGEPGVHDEAQHVFQGEITVKLLEDIGIHSCIIREDTTLEEFKDSYQKLKKYLDNGECVAFVIGKDAFTYGEKVIYRNTYNMNREDIISRIAAAAEEHIIVSTTGKVSRELFEIRQVNGQGHAHDFLTVGSMGHSSSIALGIAVHKPGKRVWCVDGDGAALMHMGALAVIGKAQPNNLIHVVINNEAHESVGGMPTASSAIDFTAVARACGYTYAVCVSGQEELAEALSFVREHRGLSFLEVRCAIGARSDLGRPTISPIENKINFMDFLKDNYGAW